ncbi:MAG: hypothetical protein LUE98_15925 [Tannerellaceae bacterium]|nr:hypothetical protein [Tannerellaceae bacterium]
MKIAVFTSILLVLTCIPLTAENYKFRHYTNKDGLSHNTVHCSLQDSRGYMWFGTEEGLNRFDGYTFEVYKHNPQDSTGLSGNGIHSLFEDSAGRIWVCTSSGLCYYDPVTESFNRRFLPFENEQDVYFSSVREDSRQNLWFIRGNLVVTYSLQTGETRYYPPEDYFHAWNVAMGDNGFPFFSDSKNLYIYQPTADAFTRVPVLHEEANISAICEIPEMGILLGTDRDGAKLYRFHNQEIEDITPPAQVRTITAYNRNCYWIGTESGIFIYDALNRTVKHLTKSLTDEYTIADNTVYSITRDMEGGMWVGSFFGGINYLPKSYVSFNSFIGGKTHPGLLGNAIREICPDQYGNLWIGTEDNGINKYDPQTGQFTNYSLNNPRYPLSATNIHGLYAEGDTLWVGTYNRGIDVLKISTGKIIQRYTIENTGRTLPTDFILCFYKTSTGRFIIGTSNGTIAFDKKTNTFSRWQPIYDLVRQIYEDRNGNIWVGTMNGLYRYNEQSDQLIRYSSDNRNNQTILQNNITSIYEDSKGDIWVTTNNGLARYQASTDSFERIFPETDFPSNILYRILEDAHGSLWISTANGLVCFDPETKQIKTYSHVDGLHESQFNFSSSYKSPDGTLFFGSISGLISFKPDEFETDHFTPPLYIHAPSLPDNEGSGDAIELPYNHATFTLSYSAISFTAPQAIQYAYQLEGIDKDWTNVNHNREVTFANLSPGKYVFRVRSTNSSGIWQDNIATLPLIITPPFWATKWALILYICILLLIIYFFYQYKKHN